IISLLKHSLLFSSNPTPPEIYTLSLHDALPISFDAGGISIKPAAHMENMKGDMAGGAGTLHGIGAVAALGLPVRALAVLAAAERSEEHTSELQSLAYLVCRLLLEKKKNKIQYHI